jgi:hypothetical protein
MILDILVIPTYNTLTLGIADASTYDTDPPVVSSPTIEITIPGFNTPVSLPFNVNDFNILFKIHCYTCVCVLCTKEHNAY